MTLKVGLDIDGVLADFNASFRPLIHEVTGKSLIPEKDFCPVWNYPQYYGYTSKEVGLAWDAIKNGNTFWYELKAYEDLNLVWPAIAHMDWKNEADFYFITSRIGNEVKHQTERWLQFHLGFQPTVLISEHKGLLSKGLELDYYLDDKIENYLSVREESKKTMAYLINRQWNNVEVKDAQRVDTVAEFMNILEDRLSVSTR